MSHPIFSSSSVIDDIKSNIRQDIGEILSEICRWVTENNFTRIQSYLRSNRRHDLELHWKFYQFYNWSWILLTFTFSTIKWLMVIEIAVQNNSVLRSWYQFFIIKYECWPKKSYKIEHTLISISKLTFSLLIQ